MRKTLKYLILSFLIISTAGIVYYILGNRCGCLWDYNYIKKHIEANYSGFFDKTKDREYEYSKLITELEHQAKKTSDFKRCDELIEKYITFFNDRHIRMQSSDPLGYTPILNLLLFKK